MIGLHMLAVNSEVAFNNGSMAAIPPTAVSSADEDSMALNHEDLYGNHEPRQPQKLEDIERVAINVSGLRFETYESTLIKHPNTLLGNRARRDRYYDYERKEYFFDRHRQSFEAILYYYQSEGRLNRPSTVPWDIFYEELCFFQIEPEVLSHLRKVEGMDEDPQPILPPGKIKRRIWLLFEYPDSSLMAKCVAFFSMAIILLSVAVFCLETVEGFNTNFQNMHNVTQQQNRTATMNANALYNIETMCVVWFTFELIVRFLTCPNKCRFIVSPMNIIDLLAIMPYYITLLMRINGSANITTVEALRVLRLARVLRIFKLSRHSNGLQTLARTFKSSMNELFMLGCILAIGVILFSSFIYFFEYERNGREFKSIPHAFWWAVVTMTTVGYGDITPKTELGQVIGSFCAITGVLCIALPVPIIVSNFTYYYKLAKLKREHRDKRRFKWSPKNCFKKRKQSVHLDVYSRYTNSTENRRMTITGMPQGDHSYHVADEQEIPNGSDTAAVERSSPSPPNTSPEHHLHIVVDTPSASRRGPNYLEPQLTQAKEERRQRVFSESKLSRQQSSDQDSNSQTRQRRYTLGSSSSNLENSPANNNHNSNIPRLLQHRGSNDSKITHNTNNSNHYSYQKNGKRSGQSRHTSTEGEASTGSDDHPPRRHLHKNGESRSYEGRGGSLTTQSSSGTGDEIGTRSNTRHHQLHRSQNNLSGSDEVLQNSIVINPQISHSPSGSISTLDAYNSSMGYTHKSRKTNLQRS